ncbi:MAG: hypothetical protein LBR66_08350, partial [Candidatus Symbiothrix sp.]|nr:hypothetical protein [Candidatus Symbiothrix sp.]
MENVLTNSVIFFKKKREKFCRIKKTTYLCAVFRITKLLISLNIKLKKEMKKIILFAAIAAIAGFSSCKKTAPVVDEAAIEAAAQAEADSIAAAAVQAYADSVAAAEAAAQAEAEALEAAKKASSAHKTSTAKKETVKETAKEVVEEVKTEA